MAVPSKASSRKVTTGGLLDDLVSFKSWPGVETAAPLGSPEGTQQTASTGGVHNTGQSQVIRTSPEGSKIQSVLLDRAADAPSKSSHMPDSGHHSIPTAPVKVASDNRPANAGASVTTDDLANITPFGRIEQQAQEFWKMLDEISQTDKEGYRKFMKSMGVASTEEDQEFIPNPGFVIQTVLEKVDVTVTANGAGQLLSDYFVNVCATDDRMRRPSDRSTQTPAKSPAELDSCRIPISVGCRRAKQQGKKVITDVVVHQLVLDRCRKDVAFKQFIAMLVLDVLQAREQQNFLASQKLSQAETVSIANPDFLTSVSRVQFHRARFSFPAIRYKCGTSPQPHILQSDCKMSVSEKEKEDDKSRRQSAACLATKSVDQQPVASHGLLGPSDASSSSNSITATTSEAKLREAFPTCGTPPETSNTKPLLAGSTNARLAGCSTSRARDTAGRLGASPKVAAADTKTSQRLLNDSAATSTALLLRPSPDDTKDEHCDFLLRERSTKKSQGAPDLSSKTCVPKENTGSDVDKELHGSPLIVELPSSPPDGLLVQERHRQVGSRQQPNSLAACEGPDSLRVLGRPNQIIAGKPQTRIIAAESEQRGKADSSSGPAGPHGTANRHAETVVCDDIVEIPPNKSPDEEYFYVYRKGDAKEDLCHNIPHVTDLSTDECFGVSELPGGSMAAMQEGPWSRRRSRRRGDRIPPDVEDILVSRSGPLTVSVKFSDECEANKDSFESTQVTENVGGVDTCTLEITLLFAPMSRNKVRIPLPRRLSISDEVNGIWDDYKRQLTFK